MKNTWLRRDNSINIQGKFNINQFCAFKDIAQTDIHYEKYMVKER